MSANMASDYLGSSDHSQHSLSSLKASPQARFRDRQKVLTPSSLRLTAQPPGLCPTREVTLKAAQQRSPAPVGLRNAPAAFGDD